MEMDIMSSHLCSLLRKSSIKTFTARCFFHGSLEPNGKHQMKNLPSLGNCIKKISDIENFFKSKAFFEVDSIQYIQSELEVCIPELVLNETSQDETGGHFPNWRDHDNTSIPDRRP